MCCAFARAKQARKLSGGSALVVSACDETPLTGRKPTLASGGNNWEPPTLLDDAAAAAAAAVCLTQAAPMSEQKARLILA